MLGTAFPDDLALLAHMKDNKAETALKIFDSDTPFDIPNYIKYAIQ
jgi:hypothetical protein